MSGYTTVDVWLDDSDEYVNKVNRALAVVTRLRDLSIASASPVALRELSDFLRMAADELERQQRETGG